MIVSEKKPKGNEHRK